MKIILDKFREVPITRGIKSGQKILLIRGRYAKQHIRQGVAPGRGAQVVGIASAEVEVSAGIRKLEEVSLLTPEVDAEFQRMLSLDPGDCVRDLKNVLEHVLRKPLRVAERGEARHVDVGKSARIRIAGPVHVGDAKLRAQILA